MWFAEKERVSVYSLEPTEGFISSKRETTILWGQLNKKMIWDYHG